MAGFGTAALIVAVVAAVAATSTAVMAGPSPAPSPPKKAASARREEIIATAKQIGLSDVWIEWLLWVAKGESGWLITAHNASDREKQASMITYERLVSQNRWPCPQLPEKYAIGSGGWFGQLAPLTVHNLATLGAPITLTCEPMTAWRDPVASMAAHLLQVAGTLNILRQKLGHSDATFLQLRALYGLPSRDPLTVDTPDRRAQYTKTLQSAGIDPAFLDRRVPDLPDRDEVNLPWP